jgi:hypothetical protein
VQRLPSQLRQLVRRPRRLWEVAYRHMTAGRRVLPDFIIVGVMKGGTTSLYSYLLQHPQVLPALKKEVHFFDLNHQRGINWYRAHFATRGEVSRQRHPSRIVTGEASPYYCFHPHAIRRIAEMAPAAKLILLLRNPVERARSHYYHQVRQGRETLSLELALEQESVRLRGEVDRMLKDESYYSYNHQHYSYSTRGVYVDQLKQVEKYFSPDRILVLHSQDLFRDVQKAYDQVLQFLGLDPWTVRDAAPRHAGAYDRSSPAVDVRLRRFFAPHNQRLYEHLGKDLGW